MQKHTTIKLSNGWVLHRVWDESEEKDADITGPLRHPDDLTPLDPNTPLFGTEVAVFIPRVKVKQFDVGLGPSSELLN
jgi:hypothetical protein